MGMANTCAQGLLELFFKNNAFANFGDASGLQPSASAGNLYISLHTADPGAAGAQNTSETSYTSYTRVAIPRSGAGWSRTNQTVNPFATISFPACTGGTATITHWGIGTASSGAGQLLYSGTVTPNIAVASGITPQLTTASSVTQS